MAKNVNEAARKEEAEKAPEEAPPVAEKPRNLTLESLASMVGEARAKEMLGL